MCQSTVLVDRHVNKKKHTLVVQQLLSRLSSILGVGALDDGVDGARLLAETAVDTFGHVDIVFGRSARTISSLLGLNGDSLSGADLLVQGSATFDIRVDFGMGKLTASQSLQAMHRSSPEGYRRRACSPRNRGEMGP